MPLNLPLTVARSGTKQGAQLVVEFDLKTKPQSLDIDLTPWSLTINQRPYFARSFFSGEVNVEGASTVVNDAAKKVRMLIPLKEAGADASSGATIKEEEAVSLGLPAKIEEWKAKRVAQVKATGAAVAKTASDLALHSGMAADSAVKDRMEAAERIEKEKATADVFKVLETLQEKPSASTAATTASPSSPSPAEAPAPPSGNAAKAVSQRNDQAANEALEEEESGNKKKAAKKETSRPAAPPQAEHELPASVSLPTRTLPPPRGAALASAADGNEHGASGAGTGSSSSKATLSFTPRVLPTPLRESKVAEEQEYLMQQQLAQQAAKAKAAAAAAASGADGGGAAAAAKANAEELSQATQAYYRGLAFAEAGDLVSALSAFQASADKYDGLVKRSAAGGGGGGGANDPSSVKRGQAASRAAACAYSLGRPREEIQRFLDLWYESSHGAHEAMALSRRKDGTIAASVIMASGGGFASPAALKDDLVRHRCLQQQVDVDGQLTKAATALGEEEGELLGGASTTLPALLAALVDIQTAAREEERLRSIGKQLTATATATAAGAAQEEEEQQVADRREVQQAALTKAVEVAPFKLLAFQNLAAFHLAQEQEKGDGQGNRACIDVCNRALEGLGGSGGGDSAASAVVAALREAVSSKAFASFLSSSQLPQQQQQLQHQRYLKAFSSLCLMRAACVLEEKGDDNEEALRQAIADHQRALAVAVLPKQGDAEEAEEIRGDLEELKTKLEQLSNGK